MKNFMFVLAFCLLLMLLMSLVQASTTEGVNLIANAVVISTDTSPPDGVLDVTLADFALSFFSNCSWSAGYARSIDGSKSGIMAKASRNIYIFEVSKYEFPLKLDLIAVEGTDKMFGGGLSLGLEGLVGFDAGIAYIPGGFGWSWQATPISTRF